MPPDLVMVTGADPASGAGGLASYVVAHARAAVRAGYAPQIFCVGRGTRAVEHDFGVVRHVRIPHRTVRGAKAALYAPFLARAIAAHATPRDGVVIHAFGPYGYAGARARVALARSGTTSALATSAYTTLGHEHAAFLAGLRREDGVRAALHYAGRAAVVAAVGARAERTGYRESTLVLVNYESVRRLLADLGVSAPVRVIPYAPATAFTGPGAPCERLGPDDLPLVVSIARHDARKGVDVLLRALAMLRDRGLAFRACLVGPGELLAAHRRLARRLRLEGLVELPGRVDDVVPYLRAASVFVLPSLCESSGSLALIEALQQGVPVVATDCDGIPEDVGDDDSALLVPPRDVAALACAVGRVLGDPALRDRLAAGSARRFAERFSGESLTSTLGALYPELAASAAGRVSASSSRS